MKRFFSLWLTVMFVVVTAFRCNSSPVKNNLPASTIKILNDTKYNVQVFTGQAHVMLYHGGGSTSVTCQAGRKIHKSDGSKKGSLIFTIDENMCGKTIKLSAYL